MSTPAKLKDERIDLRVSRSAKALLQRAAASREKSVTEFVLESGLAAAAEALADRRHLVVDSARWNAFVAMLDAPPTPKPHLRKLLKSPSVLDAFDCGDESLNRFIKRHAPLTSSVQERSSCTRKTTPHAPSARATISIPARRIHTSCAWL